MIPNAVLAESPGSIGIDSASTPGTVVGNGGGTTGGVGPAIAVGASGDFGSVHATASNAIPANNHAFRIVGHRTRFARPQAFRYSAGSLMIELICLGIGVLGGIAAIPIYRQAFRTTSYLRVLWAVPFIALVLGSTALVLPLISTYPESRRLVALMLWLVGGVVAFAGGWRYLGSAARS
jgi:hypothetical protein